MVINTVIFHSVHGKKCCDLYVTSILDNAYPLGFFKHVSETGSISVIIKYKERKVPTLGQSTEIDSIWQNLYPSTSDNGHRSSFWKVVFKKCQDNGLCPKQ